MCPFLLRVGLLGALFAGSVRRQHLLLVLSFFFFRRAVHKFFLVPEGIKGEERRCF